MSRHRHSSLRHGRRKLSSGVGHSNLVNAVIKVSRILLPRQPVGSKSATLGIWASVRNGKKSLSVGACQSVSKKCAKNPVGRSRRWRGPVSILLGKEGRRQRRARFGSSPKVMGETARLNLERLVDQWSSTG